MSLILLLAAIILPGVTATRAGPKLSVVNDGIGPVLCAIVPRDAPYCSPRWAVILNDSGGALALPDAAALEVTCRLPMPGELVGTRRIKCTAVPGADLRNHAAGDGLGTAPANDR